MFTVLYADQFESSTPPPPAPLGIPRGKFDCVLYPGIGEPELDLTSGIAEFVRGYFLVYWSWGVFMDMIWPLWKDGSLQTALKLF